MVTSGALEQPARVEKSLVWNAFSLPVIVTPGVFDWVVPEKYSLGIVVFNVYSFVLNAGKFCSLKAFGVILDVNVTDEVVLGICESLPNDGKSSGFRGLTNCFCIFGASLFPPGS